MPDNTPKNNAPKYDSGTPHVLNVIHPSGDIHAIAVDPNLPVADLHSALVNANYYQGAAQPTAEGALENSEAFRDAATKAWNEAGQGTKMGEAAAIIQNNGKSIPLPYSPGHKNRIQILSSTIATLHTHPNGYGSRPSPEDIAGAQKTGKTFYVISRDGMFAIAPSGIVTQVFNSTSDISNRKKLAK